MKTLMKFNKGLSGILFLSILILYGGRSVGAESTTGISLESTAAWWSDEWGRSRGIAWGDVDNDGDLDLAVANADEVNQVYLNQDGILEKKPSWSAEEEDTSYSIAWGDVDGDGDLDLAVANAPNSTPSSKGQNRVYINTDGTLEDSATWSSVDGDETRSIAWGDVDGDGQLDLAVGNHGANRVYLNKGGQLEETAYWSSVEISQTETVVWGDWDNDGDLDLAAGNLDGFNHIYMNEEGQLQDYAAWISEEKDKTQSLAWADANNDGYLDLMAGNNGRNRLYFNKDRVLETKAEWSTDEDENYNTYAVAWGDLDGDGYPDLAVANGSNSNNERQPNQFYINQSGTLTATSWFSDEEDETYSLAWADVDGDDDLDLATGSAAVRRIYYNQGNVLQPKPAWSATDKMQTSSIAWGDMDGDGDLDLAIGNHGGKNQVYLNENGALQSTATWTAAESDKTRSIAWGDIDGDNDLDLAIGNEGEPNYVYENMDKMLDINPIWSSDESDNTASVAWGDMDSDGDLDLAVGNGAIGSERARNRIYINDKGTLKNENSWLPFEINENDKVEIIRDVTTDIAWGDLDGDGDLDLAVGNGGANRIYRNENNSLLAEPVWTSVEKDQTTDVAWGDVDNDGDLDLAVGNKEEPNRIYLNDGEMLQLTAYWSSEETDRTNMLGWGDVNEDGNLDLAVGNDNQPNQVYINIDGQLQDSAAWHSSEVDKTAAVAWGDVDNDGDLDLAVGNDGHSLVYVSKRRKYPQNDSAYIRVDIPSDTQNLQAGEIGASQDNPLLTAPADFYATTRVWKTDEIPVAYTLFDPSGEPARFVRAFYSLDGGGNWLPALPKADVQKNYTQSSSRKERLHLDTQPAGAVSIEQSHRFMLPLIHHSWNSAPPMPESTSHTFVWDTLASGSVGQSDNVVFRIEAHLGGVNSFQRATVVAQTYPFRMQNPLQPRVQTEAGDNVADALVYRLPKGQTQGAEPFANNRGTLYHTDQHGYLQGRGQLVVGDNLMAMSPVEESRVYSSTYRTYNTSARPNINGLEFHTVETDEDQIMRVSADNPLILFDLDISLEWDARNDTVFKEQLASDLKRTSRILYDWTNGQATLGDITIYHNREKWNAAHIRIYASSTLRPNADKGGIVKMIITETVSLGRVVPNLEPIPNATPRVYAPALSRSSINAAPDSSPDAITKEVLAYGPGQVRMGALWNRFGDASGGTLSEDWPRTLAHELGHYLFFLDDNYLGVEDSLLTSISDCPGAMGDPYQGEDSQGYDEFYPDSPDWEQVCGKTLSNLHTGRSDWATISKFYPWLNTPKKRAESSGPNTLPLEVTQVNFMEPETVQAAQVDNLPLESPIFFVTESQNGVSEIYEPGPQARAILFQESSDWLIDLGRPELDQIYARGAREGDRLCVIESYDSEEDQGSSAYLMGCKVVRFGDEHIELSERSDWQPEIIVTPIDVETVEVQVHNVSDSNLSLQARFYPKNDPADDAKSMDFDPTTLSYRTTFTTSRVVENKWEGDNKESLSIPALSGHIHIWVENEDPQREMITSYSIGGNFSFQVSGYAYQIRGYANQVRGYAPIASSDGDVMIFGSDAELSTNDIYAIQTATYVPTIPNEATLIGQGYRLITANEDADLSRHSISMGYLGREVPPGKEADLIIHYWDGQTWEPLDTKVDLRQNNAVAQVSGPGLYALMVRVVIHLNGPDWNFIGFPIVGKQSAVEALKPISDTYQVVYHYDTKDNAGLWRVYGPNLPDWFGGLTDSVTDFEYNKVYWIYAAKPVDWFVRGEEQSDEISAGSLTMPPAVYYGTLPPTFQAGTPVTAWVNGTLCGETETRDIPADNGSEIAFVINVTDSFAKKGCGTPGGTVTFQFGEKSKGTEADSATNDALWDNKRIQEVELTTIGK